MFYGLFARYDHPEGWGLAETKARGYSVFIVECSIDAELDAVIEALTNPPAVAGTKDFFGLQEPTEMTEDGVLGAWFGGKFDFLASFESGEEPLVFTDAQDQDLGFSALREAGFIGKYTHTEVLGNVAP